MPVAIAGRVIETTDVVGSDPYPDLPSNNDGGLKGKAVGRGGVSSGDRQYEWLWHDRRWRVRETFQVAGDSRLQDSRCDGTNWFHVNYPQANPHAARGHVDRPRGAPTTPATFAYMPNAVWAEDLLTGMRLQALRAIRDAAGRPMIECSGSAQGKKYRLEFDPSRGYAVARCTSEGGLYAYEQVVTAWARTGGMHIPVAMEQRMRSGPSLTSQVWFNRRLTVSDLKAIPPSQRAFSPAWPEGSQIVNVPEGKMYRYTNGRMEFLMHVGGRTPARMLMGWSIIGAITVAGALGVRALTRRRRAGKAAESSTDGGVHPDRKASL
ncbi:MAG: hypothetical protein GX446_10630 [Chthonomonadales bacterium]|nr:hypothetical protein [Chthonomonadales bacterium]